MSNSKKCTVCLMTRAVGEFSPQATQDGLSSQCKNCSLVRSRLWYEGVSPAPNEVVKLMVRSQEA